MKTPFALALLLLPLLFGALACDDNQSPFPCVPAASAASSDGRGAGKHGDPAGAADAANGVLRSSDTAVCVQNAIEHAVSSGTASGLPGGDRGTADSGPKSRGAGRRKP